MKQNKREIGKKSRAAGLRFEKRVSEDLVKQGYIVIKNPNDVIDNQFKRAKTKWNPFTKRPMNLSSGFPDFICFRDGKFDTPFKRLGIPPIRLTPPAYEVIGVESKMNGILDKIEKQKCAWLLSNSIFSKILISHKGPKRGQILYKEFE